MKKKCIHHNKPKRGPYPNPMRERVDYTFKDDAAREKSLMRHPWYRKKKFLDANRSLRTRQEKYGLATGLRRIFGGRK